MRDLRSLFITWYHNEFAQSQLFERMNETVENSPWHREQNVGVHTNMVVAQYIAMSPSEWEVRDVLGAFACAFHDVGKPNAEEEKTNPETGVVYRRYAGHEMMSARSWENYISMNWVEMSSRFNLAPEDIFSVGWVIEHHLPFAVKKPNKREMLAETAYKTVGMEVFYRCLRADCWGRISDDHETKKADVDRWIAGFHETVERTMTIEVMVGNVPESEAMNTVDSRPICSLMIGASGVGKSTFAKHEDNVLTPIYSWDTLRKNWYDENDYSNAFKLSCEDKEFMNKAQGEFINIVKRGGNIIVDNTNLSVKRRRFFIDQARQNGYRVEAVLFPIDKETLIGRAGKRPEQPVPVGAVIGHYLSMQFPNYGEFDDIIVVDSNINESP